MLAQPVRKHKRTMPFRDLSTEEAQKSTRGPDPIPAGTYIVEVVEAKEDVTTNGNERVTFQLRIIEDEEFTGRKIYQSAFQSEKSRWFLYQALMALTNNQWNPEDYPDGDSLKDLTCRVIVQPRMGTDNVERPEVKKWLPLAEDAQSDTQAAKASISAGKKSRANAL